MDWLKDAFNAAGRFVKKVWNGIVDFCKDVYDTVFAMFLVACLLVGALVAFICEYTEKIWNEIIRNSDIETYLINPSFEDNTNVLTPEVKNMFLRFLKEARSGKYDIPDYNVGLRDGTISVDDYYIIVNYDSYLEEVTNIDLLRINETSGDEGRNIKRRLKSYPILKIS